MQYSLVINKQWCDNEYVLNIYSWEQVVDWLKNKLDTYATSVLVEKWSSNGRCIGKKVVRMSNFHEVVTSPTDKVLKNV